MPAPLRFRRPGRRAALAAAFCLLTLAAAAAARAWLPAAPRGPSPPGGAARPAAKTSAVAVPLRGGGGGGVVEAEQITLTPAGFEPAELTRPRGRFVLVVENRAGVEEVTLSLEREGGERLGALRSRRRHLSWDEELDLPPGRYVLSAGRPEWVCAVTITPR